MSGNRPSLASAFAPVTPRGAKLEGMLAPKRKSSVERPADSDRMGPSEAAHVPVVPQPASGPKPVNAPIPVNASERNSGSEEVLDASAATSPDSVSGPSKLQNTTRAPAKSGERASRTVPGAPRNVGVYLAPELLANVKDAVHFHRSTYADLLLDAFDAMDEEVLAREFRSESVPSASGMPRRAVRRRGSAGIQIQVRLDDDQIAWLDSKVVEFNAPSRSALVSTAFKLHLDKA